MKTIRTIELVHGEERRSARILHDEQRGYLLHDSADENMDSLESIADDSDTAVADVLTDGWELA